MVAFDMQVQTPDRAQQDAGSAFGTVVSVLAASPGSGATAVAAALADAAQVRGRRVLIVDAADGVRSGLARAARDDGFALPGPTGAVRMRFSWRAQALIARAETSARMLSASAVPPVPYWLPPRHQVELTVADLSADSWGIATNPGTGAGMWLTQFAGGTHPVLVVAPSMPGVVHAEQILARLEDWSRRAPVTPPSQLVVVGARKWPARVAASAGPRLQALVPGTIFVPHDSAFAETGVTAQITPASLRTPLIQFVDRLFGQQPGLPAGVPHSRGRFWRRSEVPAAATRPSN
ncbi:hypothetical protein AB0878_45015 [Amycolatopsis sp. NPDC047767]|uniref:hypothetical protein n=1 Tax=Amycolatopsis sp. NPDC047767 TaxID=3156765 RepID=UPI0034521030